VIEALDHVRIVAADPDRAAAAYAALLGRPPEPRPDGGRSRAWFALSNTALNIVEAAGAAEAVDGLVFAAHDLAGTRRALERRGLASETGRTADLDPAATHGVSIGLVERGEQSPAPAAEGAVEGLDHVVIHTANPERAVALYGARLGLDFRLDRANPQWGSRLMFFRCGGAVVEIGATLDAPVSDAPDRITGLAWRVRDPAAARARIAGAGFDVSEVRVGRKPGTAVFTVRSGVIGAPALMIGPT